MQFKTMLTLTLKANSDSLKLLIEIRCQIGIQAEITHHSFLEWFVTSYRLAFTGNQRSIWWPTVTNLQDTSRAKSHTFVLNRMPHHLQIEMASMCLDPLHSF